MKVEFNQPEQVSGRSGQWTASNPNDSARFAQALWNRSYATRDDVWDVRFILHGGLVFWKETRSIRVAKEWMRAWVFRGKLPH